MESLGRDLLFSVRSLRRKPGFTLVAIITLALGIGANVAIFSAIHGVLMRPLPYPEPDRLTMLWAEWAKLDIPKVSHTGGDFLSYQRLARQFEGIAAVGSVRQNLTGGDEPAQVQVGWVSRNFFTVLGIKPVRGRNFEPGEPSNSLILGDEFWQRHFAADPRVIGRTIQLDGQPFTVVGVLPRGFKLYMSADVGISTDIDIWKPPDETRSPDRWVVSELKLSTLRIIGRLKPGVSVAQAQSEMDRICEQLRAQYPDHAEAGFRVNLEPLHRAVVGHVEPALLAIQGAVGLVLLDRLPQCGQPAPGPRPGPAAGVRDPAVLRQRPQRSGPADADGGPGAGRGRGRLRGAAGLRGDPPADGPQAGELPPAPEHLHRRPGARVRGRGHGGRRPAGGAGARRPHPRWNLSGILKETACRSREETPG